MTLNFTHPTHYYRSQYEQWLRSPRPARFQFHKEFSKIAVAMHRDKLVREYFEGTPVPVVENETPEEQFASLWEEYGV